MKKTIVASAFHPRFSFSGKWQLTIFSERTHTIAGLMQLSDIDSDQRLNRSLVFTV